TTITDRNATGITNTIAVSESEIIEAVQITVDITHDFIGDVGIELVSPAGTRSVLLTPYNWLFGADNLTDIVLTSNAFYGEETDGNWTIRV
ncbi:MAG: proprotein convertase P-domain-containing protein, partial [Pseudomonadales bacterium]